MLRFKVASLVFLVIVVSVLSTTNLCAQNVQPFAGLGVGEAMEEYPIGFSLGGKLLISGSGNIWDMESQECITTVEEDRLPAHPSAISPDGKLLAYKIFDRVNFKQIVEIFDVESRERINIIKDPGLGLVGEIAFSHDGSMLALSCLFGTEFVDVKSGRSMFATIEFSDADSIAFSPDGRLFAHVRHFSRDMGNEDIIIQLWDINRRVHFGELDTMGRVHRNWVSSIAFSPDGKLLASGSFDKTIILWDIATRARTVLRGHTGIVHNVAFSPNGKFLASGSSDELKLWDVESKKRIVTFEGKSKVIFSPDGKILASGSKDGIILLWDVSLLKSPDAAARQPVASFTYLSEDPFMDTEFTFDASTSYAIDGEIVSYQWHSGDGLKKDGEIVSFTYSEAGQYLVKLVISDENGLRASSIRSITVRDPSIVTPQGKQATTWGWVRQTKLLQNYPNPFNPETWIPYQLAGEGEVVIQIFSATGELIRQLTPGHKPAGFYLDKAKAAYWDGYDNTGELVASGIYFYHLQLLQVGVGVGNFTETRKMVILK